MFERILVVCVGNICRSPVGEKLLQAYFPHKSIASAGIASERSRLVGKAADSMMIEVAAARGVDISNHRSQQLTPELCRQAELILVMEKGHIEQVRLISPESSGKVMLFGHWLEGNKDIPDPYRQSKEVFDYAYNLIDEAARKWQQKL